MTRLAVRLAVALARDVRAQLPGLPAIVNPRPAWVRAQARAMGAHTTHRLSPDRDQQLTRHRYPGHSTSHTERSHR